MADMLRYAQSPASSGRERRIVLGGELDIAAVPALDTALRAARRAGTSVALDLSRITFIDVCAARSIRNGALAASLAGQKVTLVSPSHAVERMLVLLRVEDFVAVRPAGRPDGTAVA